MIITKFLVNLLVNYAKSSQLHNSVDTSHITETKIRSNRESDSFMNR